jgi:hypothetical protein
MSDQEWFIKRTVDQAGQDRSPGTRPPADVGPNLGSATVRRLALLVALALNIALAASGALAAVLFRTPVDVSKQVVQIAPPAVAVIEGVESDVAVVDDGTVYVVWEDDRRDLTKTNTNDLDYTRSVDNGATWPLSSTLAYTTSVTLGDPTLAVSGTQVYLAWVEDTETNSVVVQKALTPTSSLTYTVPKTPTTLHVFRPDLEMDSTGRLHVVFVGLELATLFSKGHVYYSNRLPGGKWLTATRIYTAANELGAGNPRLARDPKDDSLHVVFQEADIVKPLASIRYISATNTAGEEPSWHDPVTIASDDASDLLLPDITVDRDDDIHVVWSRLVRIGAGYNEGRPHYAYSDDRGATWTPRDIDPDTTKVYAVQRSEPNNPWPRIATLPTTDTVEIYVVWEGERGDEGFWDDPHLGRPPVESVWLASSSNQGVSWGRRKVSRTSDGPLALRPVVATDPDRGTVHVTWSQQKQSVTADVIYRTYYAQGGPPSAVVYLPLVLKNN